MSVAKARPQIFEDTKSEVPPGSALRYDSGNDDGFDNEKVRAMRLLLRRDAADLPTSGSSLPLPAVFEVKSTREQEKDASKVKANIVL